MNHADPEEAKVFRALLSAHLLAAPARPALSPAPGSGSRASTPSSVPVVQADRADSPPPRKRSRPSSPALGVAEDALALGSIVHFDTDPVEVGEGGGSAPSPERYRQRTQMFERLLVFVDEGAKQPDANLVDMLSTDGFVV